MEKLIVDGVKIAFVRQGKGMPLVLIHGYPLDHSIWDAVIPLLEQDFEIFAPDLRGFGESDIMEADHSIVSYASDIAGMLTQLKIKNAVMAGHSMGGYVALAFARVFPERLSGLGLISTQVMADSAERKEGRYATASQVLSEGVSIVTDSMTPKLSADVRVQEIIRNLISHQPALGIFSALHAIADRPDSKEILAASRFPVTIVHGDADALIPVERAREMKAALPTATYSELAGIGHLPMMEKPQAVAKALKFLSKTKKTVKLLEN